jgi:hypothetical protein
VGVPEGERALDELGVLGPDRPLDQPARTFSDEREDLLGRPRWQAHGRAGDYLEVSLDAPYRYNPLHNDLEAYALAYGIASLLNNLFGKSEEPFWQQAYTNLVKFVILLHKVVDDYVTLFDVYESVINPDRIAERLAEGERRLSRTGATVLIDQAHLDAQSELRPFTWGRDAATGRLRVTFPPDDPCAVDVGWDEFEPAFCAARCVFVYDDAPGARRHFVGATDEAHAYLARACAPAAPAQPPA